MLPVGPSVVDTDPDIVTVKEGEALTLSCSFDCKPGCTFKWTGPSGVLGPGDTLTIDSVSRVDHQGTLTCEAENKYGVLSQGIDVIVYCKCIFTGMWLTFAYCILPVPCVYLCMCMCVCGVALDSCCTEYPDSAYSIDNLYFVSTLREVLFFSSFL